MRGRLKEDLNGKKFNYLLVIGFDSEKSKLNKRPFWKCKCDCGKIKSVSAKHLKGNYVKTCGDKIHYIGKNNGNWRGYKELPSKRWWIIKRGAKSRNLKMNISKDYILGLFKKQNKKCALSGLDLTLDYDLENTASLDRIDSKEGYIKDNVQWIHKKINKMKMELDQQEFISFCKLITQNNP
jgi:hypothetical protein